MMRMKNEHLIKLSKERRDEMIAEIQVYFSKERDEEIGNLGAGMVLDFIVEKLAPAFYNQGVYDAHQYLKDAAEDLLALRK